MTGPEYEAWFEKYLGDIESLNKDDAGKSPLSRIPKPLNRRKRVVRGCLGLLACMVISCVLSWCYEVTNCWYLNWLSNASLSLSLGIVASLLIMVYTNAKERNVAFYSDSIPILERHYQNMHKAYSDSSLKIDRYFYSKEFEKCYQTWRANCNTCCVILDFLKYLHAVIPFHPQSLTLSLDQIEQAIGNLTEAIISKFKIRK